MAATRKIMLLPPRLHVLVQTTLDAEETVFEVIRAGAHSFLLKDATKVVLLDSARAVNRGESRLAPQIARKVMDQFRRLASASGTFSGTAYAKSAFSVVEVLSDKEGKIL